MLTHVLPYAHYDILNSCGPNPSVCCEFDFKRMTHWSCPGVKPVPITPANVAAKARALVAQLKEMAQMYESNVLLMVHGDDFRFNMIEEWHQHHDNFLPLFEEINTSGLAEIRFGTFSDYFTALEKWYADNGKQPATLSGDFFPYK
ncbi:glycosyl hydrolase family 38 protein [Ancylostoma caninum]|uniref:Glycosyl hydrolase family 38 protein n=1 Tax=Ancylostoma caninum TaxID=29170 RepID=A0A368FZK2_ANCCA|nr:glycosyl hydrolase family 38 protein [Ancylostoma caninum]